MKPWGAVRTLVVASGFIALLYVFPTPYQVWFYGWMLRDKLTPTPVVCKVCHCGKEKCNRVCSEENMCAMRCEKECGRKK